MGNRQGVFAQYPNCAQDCAYKYESVLLLHQAFKVSNYLAHFALLGV